MSLPIFLFDLYLNYQKTYELGGQCIDMNPRCSSHADLCDSNSDYRAVCPKTCGDCKGTFEFQTTHYFLRPLHV